MTTEDFNNGDQVLIELIDYDTTDKTVKPITITKKMIVEVIVDRRGKKTIELPGHGKSQMKNFKKDNQVKGSFGMINWKSGWLNIGYKVIGGLDEIREYKLNEILQK